MTIDMTTNALPRYDASDNPTGCCPRFNPEGWDNRRLRFEKKRFVRAVTASVSYVPTDMGPVFERTFKAIAAAGAYDETNVVVLSRDLSPYMAEHYFAVSKPVAGETMVEWTGDCVTKVFKGLYENFPKWREAFLDEIKARHHRVAHVYFFYTTCPKCAAVYGENYVVGVAALTEQKREVSA